MGRNLQDKNRTALIVGHNPAIKDLAATLVKDFDEEIPSSGVVGVDLPVETWRQVRKGTGQLMYLDFPQEKQFRSKPSRNLSQLSSPRSWSQ